MRNLLYVLLLLATSAPASRELGVSATHPLVVGYLPQWGLYYDPPWFMRALVTSGAAKLLDQVDYAQGSVVQAHCAVADPNADLNYAYSAETSVNGRADPAVGIELKGAFHQLQELKRLYPHLHVLLSLEGKAPAFAEAAQPENRAAFVSSCIDMFVRGHLAPGVEAAGLFDGFDIDWEYPHAEDAANFVALLLEFRRQLDALGTKRRPGLTIASGPSPRMDSGADWPLIAATVDHIGLMNYDYNGPWASRTGPIAPLYPIGQQAGQQSGQPPDGHPNADGTIFGGSVDGSVQAYLAAGVPASKLFLGVPFYGYHWEEVASVNDGLYQPGSPVHEDRPYSTIESLVPQSILHRDARSQTPWLYDGHTFWTFDDPVSARFKAAYAVSHQLGGVMAWELSNDSADGALVKALHAGLSRYTETKAIRRPPRPASQALLLPVCCRNAF